MKISSACTGCWRKCSIAGYECTYSCVRIAVSAVGVGALEVTNAEGCCGPSNGGQALGTAAATACSCDNVLELEGSLGGLPPLRRSCCSTVAIGGCARSWACTSCAMLPCFCCSCTVGAVGCMGLCCCACPEGGTCNLEALIAAAIGGEGSCSWCDWAGGLGDGEGDADMVVGVWCGDSGE